MRTHFQNFIVFIGTVLDQLSVTVICFFLQKFYLYIISHKSIRSPSNVFFLFHRIRESDLNFQKSVFNQNQINLHANRAQIEKLRNKSFFYWRKLSSL